MFKIMIINFYRKTRKKYYFHRLNINVLDPVSPVQGKFGTFRQQLAIKNRKRIYIYTFNIFFLDVRTNPRAFDFDHSLLEHLLTGHVL